MKNERRSNEIGAALAAVASGIITNMIYSTLISINYEIEEINGTVVFVQKNLPNYLMILVIIVIFCILWWFIYFIIPFLYNYFGYLITHNIPKYNGDYVVSMYKKSKKRLLTLMDLIDNKGFDPVLFTYDIAIIIIELHKVFCPGNDILEKVMKNTIRRDSETLYNMKTHISIYEIEKTIIFIDKFFKIIYKIDNFNQDQYCKDFKKLQIQIEELKQVIRGMNSN